MTTNTIAATTTATIPIASHRLGGGPLVGRGSGSAGRGGGSGPADWPAIGPETDAITRVNSLGPTGGPTGDD